MITDGTKLKRLFLKCYSEGKNAAMAFNDAAKECEEMQREIADTRILLAAQDIKAHCKSMVCESCVFWREGTEGVFCELSAGEIPCAWEV